MGKVGWATTIIFLATGAIWAICALQGIKMPTPLFVAIITIMLLMVTIAIIILVPELLKAFADFEWQKKRIYKIIGVPRTIALGEQQIPITLRLGATRYVGRGHVYFVKEKGSGSIVVDSIVTVSFDNEKANYSPKFREKGEELQLIIKINAKVKWKGWLKIGFGAEDNDIPYVHFPITFQ